MKWEHKSGNTQYMKRPNHGANQIKERTHTHTHIDCSRVTTYQRPATRVGRTRTPGPREDGGSRGVVPSGRPLPLQSGALRLSADQLFRGLCAGRAWGLLVVVTVCVGCFCSNTNIFVPGEPLKCTRIIHRLINICKLRLLFFAEKKG